MIDDAGADGRAPSPSGPRLGPGSDAADDELVRRVQAGDRSAFDALYDRHAGRVHAICLRMCGDAHAAERLTQDAFVRVWQRIRTFRGDSAFTSWLHRLAVNVVLEDARRERRRAARVAFVHEPETLSPHARGVPDARLDLERAIATLPRGARQILVLHDIEGYKHAEIAKMLGIAVGTAKAQLHRARRLLREWMDR